MREIGNQRLRTIVTTVVALTWFALLVIMMALLFWAPDWRDSTFDRLPALYWLVFVIVIGGWVGLSVMNAVRPLPSAKAKVFSLNSMISSVIIFVGAVETISFNLISADWTGRRLFLLTFGFVVALTTAYDIIVMYREKRRRKAQVITEG